MAFDRPHTKIYDSDHELSIDEMQTLIRAFWTLAYLISSRSIEIKEQKGLQYEFIQPKEDYKIDEITIAEFKKQHNIE